MSASLCYALRNPFVLDTAVALKFTRSASSDVLYKQRLAAQFDNVSRSCTSDNDEDLLHAQLAADVVRASGLQPGATVIDVGTGIGSVALRAAQAVGSTGFVHALDLSPGMISVARKRAAKLNIHNVQFKVQDANSATAFRPGSVDAVMCSAVLPYLPNVATALRQWGRWLRPNGATVVNCYQAPYDPETGLFYRLAAKHGLPLRDPLGPLGSKERLRAQLTAAGYAQVQMSESSLTTCHPAASPQAYALAMWESSLSSPHTQAHDLGPYRARLQAMRGEFLEEAAEGLVATHRLRDGKVENTLVVLLAVARRGGGL